VKNLEFVTHKSESFCGLIRDDWEEEELNYHFLGVPIDISSTYRPGARFGPDTLRRILESENFECISEKLVNLHNYYRIKDWGNIGIIPTDLIKSLGFISEGILDLISTQNPFLAIGGDHSTTLGIGDAYNINEIPLHVVYLDAHLDLYDEVKESPNSHACTLRRLSEKNNFDGATILGYRDFSYDQIDYAQEHAFDLHSTSDLKSKGDLYEFGKYITKSLIKKSSQIHVSVDLDVLDPSFSPGIGNPVSCGLSSHEVVSLIGGIFSTLPKNKFLGWDIVEYNPLFDNSEITAFFIIKLMIETLGEQISML
jgi:agmatinase